MEAGQSELNQLLQEAARRDLIEKYTYHGRHVIVESAQGERELTPKEAKVYLRELLRESA